MLKFVLNASFFSFLSNFVKKPKLIAKINEELPNLEQCEESKQIEVHYQNTLAHIRSRMKSSDTTGLEVSFEGIKLD